MAKANATWGGWRCRISKNWYGSGTSNTNAKIGQTASNSDSWKTATTQDFGSNLNPVISSTHHSGGSGTSNMYTVCIKITTPNVANITKISIPFKVFNHAGISPTAHSGNALFGRLRTTSASTTSDNSSNWSNTVGSEWSTTAVTSSYSSINHYDAVATFTGTFSANTNYYLFLYTKDNGTASPAVYGMYDMSSPCGQPTVEYTPVTHFIWYCDQFQGSSAFNSQTVEDGGNLQLLGALNDSAGTTYTVSYNANNGSSTPSSQTSTSKYVHTYWVDDYGSYYSPGSWIYNVSYDNTMTAVYSENRTPVKLANAISRANGSSTRTVTFNANGGSCSTASLASKATITYTFAGWAVGSTSGTKYDAGTNYTPTGNVTMYATWTSSTGSYAAVTLPTPTRTGYSFQGWATSASATSGTAAGQSYTPSGNVTLYAIWKANTYTVQFNANGGTGAPSNQTKTYGTDLTLSNTKPTRGNSSSTSTSNFTITGNANGGYFGSTSTTTTSITATKTTPVTTTYTFSKWNTKADGSGTNYNAGGTYSANSAATLYAQWTSSSTNGTPSYTNNAISALTKPTRANTTVYDYKVTYNANGGTCSTASAQATKIRSYSFGGWATTSTATSANAATSYTSDKTLYAYWTPSDSGGSVSLPTPTRTGYTFKGWSTSQSATSGVTGTYTPTAATTLYATWQANTWPIDYNANGYGTAPSNQTKIYDKTLVLQPFIANQELTGYQVTFDSNGGDTTHGALTSKITKKQTYWNTKADGSGTNYGSQGNYTANTGTTMYAIWSTINGSITLPTPTRKNYTFKGWGTKSTSTTGVIGSYTPTANTTLYAIWEMSNSLIHYNNNGADTLCCVYYNDNGNAVLCNVYYNDNGTAVRI